MDAERVCSRAVAPMHACCVRASIGFLPIFRMVQVAVANLRGTGSQREGTGRGRERGRAGAAGRERTTAEGGLGARKNTNHHGRRFKMTKGTQSLCVYMQRLLLLLACMLRR